MTGDEKIAAHLAQDRIARAAQGVALALGAYGALWHGAPALILGGAGYFVFGMARPGPSPDLDKLTDR